jgi:hypothetical protein
MYENLISWDLLTCFWKAITATKKSLYIIQSANIIEPSEKNATNQSFFYCRIFVKSLPEKYDFDS